MSSSSLAACIFFFFFFFRHSRFGGPLPFFGSFFLFPSVPQSRYTFEGCCGFLFLLPSSSSLQTFDFLWSQGGEKRTISVIPSVPLYFVIYYLSFIIILSINIIYYLLSFIKVKFFFGFVVFLVMGKKSPSKTSDLAWDHCTGVNENEKLHLRCKYLEKQGGEQ